MAANVYTSAILAALALALAWPDPSAAGGNSGVVAAQPVEAVILMNNGAIAACGIKVAANISGGAATASLVLYRDAKTVSGTRFVLRGLWTSAAAYPASLSTLTLRTIAADTGTTFSTVTSAPDGAFETSADLALLDGANLFRELMLSGAIISMRDAGGARLDLEITGPVSASVRAAYLNCAGDLFGPAG
jgi:hypothetical protein